MAAALPQPPGRRGVRPCARLGGELLDRLAARAAPVEVLFGHAELLGAGSPYGALAHALLRASGVAAAAEPGAAERVRARVARHLEPGAAARVVGFLLELAGVSDPDPDPVRRAARAAPQIMREQIERAFTDWLAAETAETAAAPLLLVLEDLRAQATATLRRIREQGRALEAEDPSARGFLRHGHAWVSFFLEPAPFAAMCHAREASRCFAAIGDRRNAVLVSALLGLAEADLGEVAAGAATCRAALATAERLGEDHLRLHALVQLAYLLATRGGPGEVAEAADLAAGAALLGELSPVYQAVALAAHGRALTWLGRPDQAIAVAERGYVPSTPPPTRLILDLALITATVAAGHAERAHARARDAEAALARYGCAGNVEVPLRVACAEAHLAAGQRDAARAAIAAARAALAERAADVADPAARRTYLAVPAENVCAAELAAVWPPAALPD